MENMVEKVNIIISLLIKSLPIIFILIKLIRYPFEFCYSKKCEEYFNIPYKYFLFDWKESLLESLKYTILLTLLFATCVFLSIFRNEISIIPAISISFVFLNTLFLLCTLETIFMLYKEQKIIVWFIISLIVSIVFDVFLVHHKFYVIFKYVLAIYCIISIILCIASIFAYFTNYLRPQNKKYEIATLNAKKFCVIDIKNGKYIIKEINSKYEFDDKSIYLIVDNLKKYNLSFHSINKIKKQKA